jgi:PHD/YefM family antitoxin component YafN of YafNO toxin-antitoxin module
MLTVHPQYITDDRGKKLSVVLPIAEFKSIMEELEELEDIRLYDESKASDTEPAISMEEAFKLIEGKRGLID